MKTHAVRPSLRSSLPLGALVLAACIAGGAAPLTFQALKVTDGDTIVLNGEKIRLEGIDAPEMAQRCLTPTGQEYRCGKEAADALRTFLSNGPVVCKGATLDDYGRRLGTCYSGALNVNAAMVESGHAFAFIRYSSSYVAEESRARAGKAGMFAGKAEAPWDFRAAKWQNASAQRQVQASADAQKECPIKGNISKGVRIYHMPWSASYAKTSINESKGERWFCSEAEAIAAGWRAPRGS
ncbi:Staphylococcal nuclease homologue [Pannonibacter phragmitetus]|uniref:Staphylococcal nuclease homologue n=1 Tax=Pannonibacter phragmitetus TaxID=121719 RepID=A0A378ZU08_9HYPH|nr:Staphylococcal nuclease homologue [Pannonibacter phragmitetus]